MVLLDLTYFCKLDLSAHFHNYLQHYNGHSPCLSSKETPSLLLSLLPQGLNFSYMLGFLPYTNLVLWKKLCGRNRSLIFHVITFSGLFFFSFPKRKVYTISKIFFKNDFVSLPIPCIFGQSLEYTDERSWTLK